MSDVYFYLPDYINEFYGKIWQSGHALLNDGAVYEAYALDKNHACCKVHGTMDYTVTITIVDERIDLQCNCPYFGNCKHELATLLFISNNPRLELVNKKLELEISILDDYKLFLSELEYD